MDYYDVNVSQHGRHIFATHERSLTTEREAYRVYLLLRARFPAAEGYELSVTHWQTTGKVLTEQFARDAALRDRLEKYA
jgi:hypothetical protein